PIVDFLRQDDRTHWRYQTFGFGVTVAQLGYLVDGATLDGGYYSARTLPELTQSGIEQIDYALWLDGSGTTVRRILARADDFSLRWAFIREERYLPFLEQAGFRPKQILPGGVQVWENPSAPPLAADAMRFGSPDAAGLLWGTLPPLTLLSALAL